MTSRKNRHGLSRDIDEGVKRFVRQRCGFGCVVCGEAIVEYHHAEPEFKDSRTHNPFGIALLCPTCHSKATRKLMSPDYVMAHLARPKARQQGFSTSWLAMGPAAPHVRIAGSLLKNCPIPIMVRDEVMIGFKAAEVPDGPVRLSASFHDSCGKPQLKIVDNECRLNSGANDIVWQGSCLTIRETSGKVSLMLRIVGSNEIRIEKINQLIAGYRVEGDHRTLMVTMPGGQQIELTSWLVDGCPVGVLVGSSSSRIAAGVAIG